MSSSEPLLAPRRYGALLGAAGLVALGLLVFELVGSLTLGWSPKMFWTGTIPMEWYDWRNNGRLVAGAQLARRESSTRGLGLMVGASTTHFAVTSQALDRCDNLDLDWLVITSSRMSFTVMEEHVFEPLAMSPELAKPSLLVMGIHLEMLVGASETVPTFSEAVADIREAVAKHRYGEAAGAVGRASFIIHIRGRIANTVERAVTRARYDWMRDIHQPLQAIFYPPMKPYEDHIPASGNTRKFFPDRIIQHYVQAWNAQGFADPSKFSAHGEQADALRRIMSRYPGVPVVFVVFPVRSEFRDVKQPILAVWNELFRELAATRSVSVFDFSDQLNNDQFKDVGHANLSGRAALQRLVPAAVALASGKPIASSAECQPNGRKPVTLVRADAERGAPGFVPAP